jgi:hypothetical protein
VSSGVEIVAFPFGLAAFAVGGAAMLGAGLLRAGGGMANAVAARQQRRIEAAAREERARIEFDAVRHRVEDARRTFGDLISPPPDIAPGDLPAATAFCERRLREELAAAGTAALVAGLAQSLGQLRQPAAPAGPVAPGPGGAPDPRGVAETVRRVLGRLDSAVPESVRAQVHARASHALAATPGQAASLVDDLRAGIQQANDDLANRRARLADLHQLLDRHTGEQIDQARRLLYGAADDPDPDWPALELAVEAAIAEVVAAAVERYTATALREALAGIGCEVEEDFDTLLVDAGMAHVRRPEWNGLAVRVRRQPREAGTGAALRLSLIGARGAPGLDEDTERGWCGTVDTLLPALRELGVETAVRERSEIGAGHVQLVDPARFPFRYGAPAPPRRQAGEAPSQRALRRPR